MRYREHICFLFGLMFGQFLLTALALFSASGRVTIFGRWSTFLFAVGLLALIWIVLLVDKRREASDG